MCIRRVVDLSLAIDANTQLYPGDPSVRFAPAATVEADGFNLLSVQMVGSQSGTNCDAPYHSLEHGARIDELDLSLSAGPGVITTRIPVPGSPCTSSSPEPAASSWRTCAPSIRSTSPNALITAFPLQLTGADGAPTRAVATNVHI